MPYIKKEDREKFLEVLQSAHEAIKSPGELNYFITQVCRNWIYAQGLNYAHHAEVIGALECVKQEFYRKVTAPYENQKCSENGEVY